MTADSEAMTLALAEAFRLGKIHRENQFYEHAGDTGERFEKLVADTVAHLSCAAEPVGELVRLGSSPYTGEYGSVFWRDNTPPPCGTKLYTHQSEDARDLDAKDANRFRFWCGRTQCDLDHWRREIDAAMAKENGNG